MLIPLWGRTPEDPHDPSRGRFERYASSGDTIFRLDSLEDCDAAIFPQSWGGVIGDEAAEARAAAFVDRALAAAKPPVIFFWNDSSKAVGLDATVFRTSLFRSKRLPREFAQPAWSEDFVERYLGGHVPIRSQSARPVVGFCGSAPREPRPTTTAGRMRQKIGRRRHVPEQEGYIRARALDVLERHPDVDTNVVARETFWGGMAYIEDLEGRLRVRREYVQNIVDSDYVLCARGAGNFSYRLYETLCCGRIPVFIDTDCVLPLESVIDWKSHVVWVDESDVPRIGDLVAAFHASLSSAEFEDRQRACRRLWETHLSPHGFFAHFHTHFA